MPEKVDFYDGCIKVYEAVIALLQRFADAAEECGTEKARFAAENLRALTCSAPRTLAQAMQLTLLFYRIETDLDQTTVRSLGGLDRLYAPFYRSDLASGRFTEANLRELTDDFLWKISAMGTTANLPFYIGGKDDAGHDACNEYTRVLLEEYRRLDIYDPKIHVMYHGGFDRELLDFILTMIRKGKNSFVFINTDAAVNALEQVWIAPEDARHLTVYGCYETAAEGTEVPATCGGNVNLAKAVELALNNGTDPVTGIPYGPKTGSDFDDFDAFLKAVRAQVEHLAVTCMDTIVEYERHYGECFATPVISATFASSAESGRDLYAGGAKYNNTSVVGAGLATLVDSVMTVKGPSLMKKR